MAVEGSKRFWGEFLEIYRLYPCLWNKKCKEYNDKHNRNKAYEVLIQKLKRVSPEADKDYAIKKINSFRSAFRREHKKVRESTMTCSSPEDIYVPSLWYYDLLLFTATEDSNLSSISNMKRDYDDIVDELSVDNLNADDDPPWRQVYSVQQEHHSDSEEQNEISLKRKSKSFENKNLDLIDLACRALSRPSAVEDECDAVGKMYAYQLRSMDKHQRLFAEKLISDVMFHGRLGRLTEISSIYVTPP